MGESFMVEGKQSYLWLQTFVVDESMTALAQSA